MKELTIVRQQKFIMDSNDIAALERKINISFPQVLRDFLLKYEGAVVKETYYLGKPTFKKILNLRAHETKASIEAILEGHSAEGYDTFIPFAIDSGGWDYNVSIHPQGYGQVWVNKFDNGEENTFELVAPSFESFVDNLTPPVEEI
jgi:cell wall assembly regulator SMI1